MHDQLDRLRALLIEFARIDLGFPQGQNIIRPPLAAESVRSNLAQVRLPIVECLDDFYSLCNGLSLPDVWNGYWIDSVERMAGSRGRESAVLAIGPEEERQVIELGSTGGGDLFAIDCRLGQIYFLPPGLVQNHCYRGEGTRIRVVASSLAKFLELLVSDVDAFVHNDGRHRYIDQT